MFFREGRCRSSDPPPTLEKKKAKAVCEMHATDDDIFLISILLLTFMRPERIWCQSFQFSNLSGPSGEVIGGSL